MLQTQTEKATYFYEQQRLRQPWIWVIGLAASLALFCIPAYGLYQQLVLGQPFGNRPMSDLGFVIFALFAFGIAVGLPWLLYNTHLTVWISDEYIHIRYFPFVRKRIPLRHIAHAGVRTYHPILEYGGWGIRMSLRGRGWAFTVGGNRGVQLHFKSGKRMLIGSQKPEELLQAIRRSPAGNVHASV